MSYDDCHHQERTESSESNTTPAVSTAVERVRDAHPHLLGLASAAARDDVEEAQEHIEELRTALDEIEALVLDGGRDE